MTARSTVLSVLAVMLVVLAAFTGCSSGPATTTGIAQPPSPQELEASGFLFPELPRITAEGLKHMIDTGEPVVVVDTRLPMFFNGGHIPESVNIPIVTSGDLEDPQGFADLPKDKAIVFYCD